MRLKSLDVCLFAALMLVATTAVQGGPKAGEKAGTNTKFFTGTKDTIENGRVTAFVNIEGYFFPMIVDTGASADLALLKPVVDQMGLEVEKVDAASGYFTAMARVGTDRQGTLSGPIRLLVLDTPIVRKHYGVIGWLAVKKTVIELDVSMAKWQQHAELPADTVKHWQSFPIIEDDSGGLHFIIQNKDQQILVVLDTGSKSGVSLSKKDWEKWRQKNKPEWVTLDSAFSPATRGGFSVTKKAIAENFHLGGLKLGRVSIEETFAEIRMNGEPVSKERIILGMEALMHRRIVIDGPGKRVYFGPLSKTPTKPTRINRAQATYIPQGPNSKVVTAHVIKDGVAYRAGLRDGDQVLMVNGVMASTWKTDESIRPSKVFSDKPGTRVRLLIEREGKRFPITIELGRSPLDTPADAEDDQP